MQNRERLGCKFLRLIPSSVLCDSAHTLKLFPHNVKDMGCVRLAGIFRALKGESRLFCQTCSGFQVYLGSAGQSASIFAACSVYERLSRSVKRTIVDIQLAKFDVGHGNRGNNRDWSQELAHQQQQRAT